MVFGFLLVVAVIASLAVWLWSALVAARRAEFIRTYRLPDGLFDKLCKKHPHLTLKDCQLVGHALRQFFVTYLKSERRFVSMPSQVVDDLWHELILYTRQYQSFCQQAFGRFMHHSPAIVLSAEQRGNEGLRRCWHFACLEEHINPRKPTRLPLLFAIDRKLQIADGFVYEIDCLSEAAIARHPGVKLHCAGNLVSTRKAGATGSCGSGCSGGGGGGHGGCSGGCSGGCGGGCGGS
jgi:hypothetical protein